MIKLEMFVFSGFQENTFLLYDETGKCLVIDPGCFSDNEEAQLSDFLHQKQLTLQEILFTHCHLDHIFGARFLSETFPGVPRRAHRADEFLVDEGPMHARLFGVAMEQPPSLTAYLEDGETILLGNSSLKVLHTPGHSPGSVCFYCAEQSFLIAGDLLFAGSVGRTDLPRGDMNTLLCSIRDKIFTLPGETRVYAGHGPATSIEHEQKNNPFLRSLSQ